MLYVDESVELSLHCHRAQQLRTHPQPQHFSQEFILRFHLFYEKIALNSLLSDPIFCFWQVAIVRLSNLISQRKSDCEHHTAIDKHRVTVFVVAIVSQLVAVNSVCNGIGPAS